MFQSGHDESNLFCQKPKTASIAAVTAEKTTLGEGEKAAAGRRDLAKRLEEGRRRERQASYLAHVRGQGLSCSGQIFVM